MKTITAVLAVAAGLMISCNHGLSSGGESGGEKTTKINRGKKTVIDAAEYVDFTVKKNNAKTVRREDMLSLLNGAKYKNGNSSITLKMNEGVIEISSDSGFFKGKKNCQVYGVYAFDIQAAGEDCLYIRKDQKKPGYLLIDGVIYHDSEVPDLAACLPLYGYSRNRIEVSSVMDGYIAMPSGTYWRQ